MTCRYGFEIRSPRFNEMTKDLCPVVSRIPRDFTGWVNFHGHNLAYATALHKYNEGSDATTATAAILSPVDISRDKSIMARHI